MPQQAHVPKPMTHPVSASVVRDMEWLWWALLFLLVFGWPLLVVLASAIRRRVRGDARDL